MSDAIDKIEYRNHTIKVHVDETAMNPFTDWEGEPPILVAMNDGPRDMRVIEYGLDDSLPDLPDAIVRANWRNMLRGLDYAPTWRGLLALARDEQLEPGRGESILDLLREEWSEYVAGERTSDRLEHYAVAYGWLGIPAVCKSVHGHCQGDYGEVLAVALPEWGERVGASEETLEKQLNNAVRLFEDYAFGNVYGYTVDDENGEPIDASCWGFYGDEERDGYMLDQAKMDVDAYITSRIRDLNIRIDELIELRKRARVDILAYRHVDTARLFLREKVSELRELLEKRASLLSV